MFIYYFWMKIRIHLETKYDIYVNFSINNFNLPILINFQIVKEIFILDY